jgi:hypothetical protein
MRLFSEGEAQVLAECDRCKRVLKVPRTRCMATTSGFLVRPAVQCPCGNVSDRIDRESRAGSTGRPEGPSARPPESRGLSEKSRRVLEEEPGFFLHVERIWQLIRDNLQGPVLSFDEISDLKIGWKEGEFALVILRELGKLELVEEGNVRIVDNTPITDYRPKDLRPVGEKQKYGKMCRIQIRGGDVQAIHKVHGDVTSEVFSKFSCYLAPIEGDNYASVSANPDTGEMIFSFSTKPISEQEFEHFDTNVNSICAKHARGSPG